MAAHDLLALLDNPSRHLFQSQAGEMQRNLDSKHLNELKQYQQDFKAAHNMYSFPSSIFIAMFQGKYALLDGQHRLETCRFLLDTDPQAATHIQMPVSILKLRSLSEYDDYFVALNKNKPVRLYKNVRDWKNVMRHLETYFYQNYRLYLRDTNHPRVPNFNLDHMMAYIDENNLIQKIGLPYEELINEIEQLNNCYRFHWKELIQKPRYIEKISRYIQLCEEKSTKPFYLGIYRHFEWLDRIAVHRQQGIPYLQMKHVPLNYRHRISKRLRRAVWSRVNGTTLVGKCYVCDASLDYDTFECGHIVSVFCGGDTDQSNLRPICRMCNSDMGIENLEDFRQRWIRERGSYAEEMDTGATAAEPPSTAVPPTI